MTTALPAPCDESLGFPPAEKDSTNKTGVLTATILGSSLAFVMGSIVNVALPSMQADFATDAQGAQWIINSYLLPVGALILLGGALGDHYGRKRVFQAGLIIFTLGTIACALAPNLGSLLAMRALQGLGAALLAPNSLAIISTSFTEAERGKAIGTWAGMGAFAGAIAPVLGGWAVDLASWRWAFALIIPLGLLALVIGQRAIAADDNGDADSAPLDWAGAFLITIGLAALVWTLTALPQTDIASGAKWLVGSAAVAVTGLFLIVEKRKQDQAMVPLNLFNTISFAGISLLTLFLYAALGGLLVLLPFLLINAGGYSATETGFAILPFPLTMALLSRYAGGLSDRFGVRMILTVGPAIVAAGFFYFSRLDSAEINYWRDIFPALMIIALGMTASVAPLTTAVMASVSDEHGGIASGINNAISRSAGLIATALLGFVLVGSDSGNGALVAGFANAAWVGALLALVSAVAAWLLIRLTPAT
ncbi:MFS transporter [Parasphingorhabdus cellanae]|uniref:MFS transporter n=1 Tax=Parasphingorhabdus cellanae TaxID=2806553 RepID=A0ABX7T6X2_9SPHN|nr:MFS transporter [Parasphingorhabdus cellanae]QTD56658.1 MFS transporter [Parasphingorhabdus cellanae]